MLLRISARSARSTPLDAAACASSADSAKISSRISSAASMSSREREHLTPSPVSCADEARAATSFLVSPLTRSRHGSIPLGLLDSQAHSTSCRSFAWPLSDRAKNVTRQPIEVVGGASVDGVGPLGAPPASKTPARMYSVYVGAWIIEPGTSATSATYGGL